MQSMLMIVSFMLRHNITDEALKDLLSILDLLFPNMFPTSKYKFYKAFDVEECEIRSTFFANVNSRTSSLLIQKVSSCDLIFKLKNETKYLRGNISTLFQCHYVISVIEIVSKYYLWNILFCLVFNLNIKLQDDRLCLILYFLKLSAGHGF